MALGGLKKLAMYLGAGSAAAILPYVSKHPKLLGKLLEKMKDRGVANARERSDFAPKALERKIAAIEMLFETMKRKLPELSANAQRKLVFNLWYNDIVNGDPVRDAYRKETGEWPPSLIVISPSMRCDLKCEGCYAAEYAKFGELTIDEVNDLIRQGKEDLGVYFYTILGGEPTHWPHILEMLDANPDVYFQLFTHGQSFTKERVAQFEERGNVMFAVSIEGDPTQTDHRRGEGSYERITDGMKNLRDAGLLFGFSATHTTKNHEVLVNNDDFIKDMVDRGCAFGWVFQYIPLGREPSRELMVTPEMRIERLKAIWSWREKYPILTFDFWNDGEIVEGCMAYGRRYFHITSSGAVEPCVFVHFSKDNVRDKGLKEILLSDYFKAGRRKAPFTGDHRAPCSFLDNTDFLPEYVREFGLKPSHAGADSVIKEFHEVMATDSKKYRELLKDMDEDE